MKRLMIGLALGLCAAGSASAETITFEDVGFDVPSYTKFGVTFTPAFGTLYGLPSPNGTVGLVGADAAFSTFAPFRADISGGTDMVSIDLGDLGFDADEIYLQIYDASDMLLGETSLLIPENVAGLQTLSLSSAGIAYALFGSRGPAVHGSSVYADNFVFNNLGGGVPEPASWALMIGGFGFVGGALRARRRPSVAFA